jgi:hypothetical protein
MERRPARAETGGMVNFSIRCHPTVPVATDELEEWLELQLERLRRDAPTSTMRLSRVAQPLPSGTVDVGWLVDFEVPEAERLITRQHVSSMLTDMRLLGFQPTVLAPVATSAGSAASLGESQPHDADDDQADRDDPRCDGWVPEPDRPGDGGADGADARPHGVRGTRRPSGQAPKRSRTAPRL